MRPDHFGLLAPIYERFVPTPDLGRLRAMLDLKPTDRLLDIGGGTGRISAQLSGGVADTWIADYSYPMLRGASDKGLVLCQSVAEGLPFADAAFDKVLAVDSFHHFWDHALAAREMMRVLKPGGRLIIEEPDVRRFGVKLVALAETLALMRSHFRRPEELLDLFTRPDTSVEIAEAAQTYWLVVDRDGLHPIQTAFSASP